MLATPQWIIKDGEIGCCRPLLYGEIAALGTVHRKGPVRGARQKPFGTLYRNIPFSDPNIRIQTGKAQGAGRRVTTRYSGLHIHIAREITEIRIIGGRIEDFPIAQPLIHIAAGRDKPVKEGPKLENKAIVHLHTIAVRHLPQYFHSPVQLLGMDLACKKQATSDDAGKFHGGDGHRCIQELGKIKNFFVSRSPWLGIRVFNQSVLTPHLDGSVVQQERGGVEYDAWTDGLLDPAQE